MAGANLYSPAYAIFEGGDAKGIAHVGALRALEEEQRALLGVAGTSAGAIVAALVAVGYTARELYEGPDSHILKTLELGSPVDLLGRAQWRLLKHWRRRLATTLGLLAGAGVALIFWWNADPARHDPIVMDAAFAAAAALFLVALWAGGGWFWTACRQWGLFKSQLIFDTVNKALRRKLEQHYADLRIDGVVPKIIQFRDIDKKRVPRCIPLKIVATNITSGELTLFDERHPEIPVAAAVAASAALPFAFCPARVAGWDGEDFADGGLVSNLPAWVFRDDKRRLERDEAKRGNAGRVPIYGFTFQGPGEDPGTMAEPKRARTGFKGALAYGRRVVTTGIFGSQTVVQYFVPDLEIIKLPTKLTTMKFDCTPAEAEAAVKSAYDTTMARLRTERIRALVTKGALDAILTRVRTEVAIRRADAAPNLRVALIEPVRRNDGPQQRGRHWDIAGFKVCYGANMAQDADDTLELDPDGKIAPVAYLEDRAVYHEIAGNSAAQLRMTKYERALLPRSLNSIIAVPVYPDPSVTDFPSRVLAIDSSDMLQEEFDDPVFMAMLRDASALISDSLIDDAVRQSSLQKATTV